MSYPSGLASYGDQHPLGPASPTPSPASREMLRGKFCSPTKTNPPPRQGLCCPENQRNAPNPFAPPPHLQSHPKKLNRPGSTLQTLQHVHSSSGYHKDPRCHAPPPQIHVPKHTDGHATSPGEGMGESTSFSHRCPRWGRGAPPASLCRAMGHLRVTYLRGTAGGDER